MGDPVSLSCIAKQGFGKAFDPIVTYLVIYPITALYLCKQNCKKLKDKLHELDTRRKDLQQKVKEANEKGECIFQEVQEWMIAAEEHISGKQEPDMDKLKEKSEKKYCFGWCPNPKALYDLSEKAKKYAEVVDQLMQQAEKFYTHSISHFLVQKRDKGAQDGFIYFESRNKVLKEIMNAVRGPSVNMIGVWGMLGMGKTILVKQVKGKAEEEKLFDVVVMAKVTRNPDLTKIQDEIARGLGMYQLSKELTPQQVADRINKQLTTRKALVILDDIWGRIDLEDLGIPSGSKQKRPDLGIPSGSKQKHREAEQQNKESSPREEQKECKVLLTARDQKVLSEKMGVKNENIFQVDKLGDEEARELFKLRVEDDIESSDSFRSKLAIEIVKRCAGVPLAIENVAMALRGKKEHDWNHLLQELRASKGGEYAVVSSAIEFSFSQLESEELRQTFLLCCLMGHNTCIEDLMEYGICLKLFPEVNKIEDARDAARTLVDNLKGSSLLLDGPSDMQFDMQDAVRDAAISIASRERGVLASSDEDATEVWPDEEAMKKLSWIYLSNADIGQLLQELESVHNCDGGCQQVQCPQLTFLYFSNKYPSSESTVPADFFKGMKNLRVLSLTKMHFSLMPQSISLLTNLRTLRLNQTKLGVLEGMGEIIGKLKNLQVLNLAGCDITELPKEIACLMRLKLLDMSDCTSLKVISPDILSKLSRLEELKMANSFDQWQFIEQHKNQKGNASLAELKYLQKLTTLEVCINDIQMIPEGLFKAELKRYKIFIGDLWKYRESPSKNSKILKLELKAGSSYSSVIKILEVSEELHLEGLHGVKNVVYQLDSGGFQKLRCLYVQNAPEIQFMIDSERLVCSNAFPELEELVLQNLIKMEKICRELDPLGATSFNKLRIITIEYCHQLKNLFSFSVVKLLLQLQEINLKDCENIEEIVAEEAQVTVHEIEEAATKIELGQLRSLRLEKLPNFIGFCQVKNSRIIDRGSQLPCMPLFNEKVGFPMLEELHLIDIKINKIWNTSATADCVKKLTKLSIVSCCDLKYLFSSSLANDLVKLLHLEIADCKSLTKIIDMEIGPETGNCYVKFPSLKRLSIIVCPELVRFMVKSKSTNEADDALPFFDEHVAFPSLESIILYGLKNTQMVWHNQLCPDSFCNLKELDVRGCENLMTIFPKDMMGSFFKSIEKLTICSCASIEDVFKVGEINLKESVQTQLRNLLIYGLPSLKHVWNDDPKGILTFHNMESVIVSNCPNIKNVFPISIAKGLKQLQKLQIESCGVDEIVAMGHDGTEAVVKFVFLRLSGLTLKHLRRLRYFYPGKHITLWPELKKLNVFDCGSADQAEIRNGQGRPDFPVGQPLFYMKEVIPQLERLSLSQDDIARISESRFKQDFFFNIKVLRIYGGGELAIFPIGFLRRFYNLEKLVLTECSLEELFPSHGHGEVEEEQQKHFETQLSRIKTLKLESIVNLTDVWSKDSSSVLQNLETLEVIWCYDLINLSTSTTSFKNLTTLEVWCCHKMENLVSVAIVQSLVHVKSMTVGYCYKLSEIVRSEGDGTQDPIILSSLRYFKLIGLIRLACLCSGNFIFDFPCLEQLIVEQCPKLEIFSKTVPKTPRLLEVQGGKLWKLEGDLNTTVQRMYTKKVGFVGLEALSLSEFPQLMEKWHTSSLQILDFRCLCDLNICNCNSLRYLLTPSMVRSLVSLLRLKVENCRIMEAVIMEEGAENVIMEGGAENAIKIPSLNDIILDSCSDLTSFYVGSCTLQCLGLKGIGAINCRKMVTFTSSFSEEHEKEDSQAFFSNKVAFPNLEWLTITHLKNLEIIWHSKLYADSFCRLKSLIIENCENLSTIFPSTDIEGRIWKSLEELNIYQCGSLKGIFEIGEFNVKQTHAVINTKLRELIIDNLPRLKHVWNKDPQEILTFHNLESVEVSYCRSLKILFPTSIGKGLLQLQKLHLYECGVEEIVTMGEEGAEAIVNFEFPRLSSLKLEVLPRLRYFYPRKHTLVWPKLKEFYFSHFNQVKRTDRHGQLDFPIQLPLFSIEKIIPQLEELSLTRHEIVMASEHQFKQDLFFNIKVLQIQGYLDDESDALPIKFMQSFCHLEKLVVRFFNFKELFPSKGEVEEQEKHIEIETLSRIKTLNLEYLPCLRRIWSHDSSSVLQNIESLQVLRCDSLINLSASVASFRNLITLNIAMCPAILNLVSVSIAQSLVQLERMTISYCLKLTGIVGNEGDGMQDLIMITFIKLRFLTLQCLTRLESFCSGKFTFKFPFLEKVIVNQCPKLKIFCEGDLNTPLLQRVELIEGEDKWRWEGNLNTTIQRMYMEKVGSTKLEFFTLSNFSELLEIWHIRNPQELLDFRQIQVLEICDSNSFKYLLTHSMALGLVQLKHLIVINCGTMEQVIMGGAENQTEFPYLSLINLESCSDLTSFYLGSHSLQVPSLINFIVKDCPKMVTFAAIFAASTSFGDHNKEASQYLFSSKVETPNLDFLSLSSINIQQIWDNSIPKFSPSIQYLRKLCVEGCGNLKYLLTCSMVKSFEQLQWLEIGDCKMMEEVIFVEESVEGERMCKIFFTNLEFLLLQDLPKLTRFCSGNYLELPCLWKLKIRKCPMLKTFISSFIFKDMTTSSANAENTCTLPLFDSKVAFPKLERLVIEYMEGLKRIWNYQLEADSFCQLTLVNVVSCEKLLNIFPFSMVERLQRLDQLQIWNCDSLEAIFESNELDVSQSQDEKATLLTLVESTRKFVFLKLTHLDLYGLPKLEGFFLQTHVTEWPSLKKLWIYGCDQVQIFALELSSFQRIREDDRLEIQIKYPLFLMSKATFPFLEELKLEKNDNLKEIWNGQYPGNYFPKLKVLKLICIQEQLAPSLFFFQSLPNLEKLVVSKASFDEIFQCERLGSEKESEVELVFYNLRTLEVLECSKLRNLVPSFVSFNNLQSLEVSKCHGLVNLVTHKTGKSLVHLTRMSITECDMVEEIIACLEDDVKDGIVFTELKYLQLRDLPALASFSSMKCKFEFPSLEEVIVKNCPRMQTFSGEISTPKLQRVKLTEDEDKGFWEGNLNSTIQFMQKSVSDLERYIAIDSES